MPPSRSRLSSSRHQSAAPARSGTTPSVRRQEAVVPPPYEPPLAPLNPKAIHSLSNLPDTHNLGPFKEQIHDANQVLTDAAVNLNELLWRKQNAIVKKRRKLADRNDGSANEPIEGEEETEELRKRIDALVKQMDEKVRALVDVRSRADAGETALKEIHRNVVAGQGRVEIAPTQSTLGASQFRPRRTGLEDEDEDEGDESEKGMLELLRRRANEHEQQYNRLSKTERYAQHNDYVGFKKSVHDAKYQEDNAPPLPDRNRWFPDENNLPESAAPGTHGGESDSEIEAVSERISIKCPVTLRPMKEPVTSNRCPHSFEKDAILDMIQHSALRENGSEGRHRSGPRALQCPVCEVILTAADLTPNPVLARKIKRMQEREKKEAEQHSDEDEDDDDVPRTQRRRPEAELIGSEDEAEESSGRPKSAAIKEDRERTKTMSIVPRTQVSGPDEEDDEMEEEREDEGHEKFEEEYGDQDSEDENEESHDA